MVNYLKIGTKKLFMRTFVLLFVLSAFFAVSCDNDDPAVDANWYEGVVYWTGAPEVDGCGWLLLVEGVSYHVENLPDAFKVDNLEVWIKTKEVDDVYNCGLGQIQYATLEIRQIIEKPDQVRFLSDYPGRETSMDLFSIDSVIIDGDTLRMHVGYSGGCAIHQFNLWALESGLDGGGDLHLMLEHIGNGDMCEAYLREWLTFSLRPIQQNGTNEVKFWLRGNPVMSSLLGEFVYRY